MSPNDKCTFVSSTQTKTEQFFVSCMNPVALDESTTIAYHVHWDFAEHRKLVGFEAVVLIICRFQCYACLSWKRLFTSRKRQFGRIWPPKSGKATMGPPKGTSLHGNTSYLVVIYSRFRQNLIRSLGATGGRNLSILITLANANKVPMVKVAGLIVIPIRDDTVAENWAKN